MKNVIFSIFRFKITKSLNTEVRMNWEDGLIRPEDFPSLEDYFEAYLPEAGMQLPIFDKGRTAKASTIIQMVADDTQPGRDMKKPHRSDIVAHRDKITVLTIQANASKAVIDYNNNKHKMEHYPSTHVIIDNRPGHQIMAIEHTHQTSAMDPERIVRLLLNHFNACMTQVGVQFEIKELTRIPDFYEACDSIIHELHDNVRKLELNFPSDRRCKGDDDNPDYRFLCYMQDWFSTFAKRGHLAAMLRDNETFLSAETRKKWTFIADVCAHNYGYFLRIKFENFGWFQYGQETVAQYGINKDIVDYFTGKKLKYNEIFDDGDPDSPLKTDLAGWLSKIVTLIEIYNERSVSKRKGAKRYSPKASA